MATLTYDSTDPNAPDLNEAEQEALAIGEAAEAEQQQLLAGKFKDAEALEQAYIELQQKLGTNEPNSPPEEAEPQEASKEEEEQGEEVEQSNSEEPEEGAAFLTDQDVEAIHNIAGGPDEYDNMLQWAAGNLSKDDIEAFDHVIGLNDARAAAFAVSVLSGVYKNSVGSEGEMITGTKAAPTIDVFESQAQVVEAMSDPKYDRDPAYRKAVMQKLERSNVQY